MSGKQPRTIEHLTRSQFHASFPDDHACRRYLMRCRWPAGVRCPRCGNDGVYDASSFRPFHWMCKRCNPHGYRFSVTAGTVFHGHRLALRDWFRIIHLMTRVETVTAIQDIMDVGINTPFAVYRRVRALISDGELAKIGLW